MLFARGLSIGPWRLVERLGSGGMGEVWRADGPSGDAAALKILRPAVGPLAAQADENNRRFEREATVALALRHPNVVRALDFGQHAGTTWLAMELLEGESLHQRLVRLTSLDPIEAMRIGLQAARGLGAAHAAGILHRDVKPANIFLCRDGVVKMLDFGLALPLGLGGDARITEMGIVLGTPSYMAPEQATGERTEDVRTDVWALGAVLHHALSGRPPFWAGGQSMGELVRIVGDPPDPLPSTVPARVAVAVLRALEKEPAARFANMVEMSRALDECSGEAAPSPTSRKPPRLREEVRLVTALLAEGVRSLPGLLETIRRHGGTATPLLGGRAVGLFGGAQWTGDEPERAVRAALEARDAALHLGVGTGKAVVEEGGAGALAGAALAAAAEALHAASVPSADRGDTAGVVGACAETRRRVGAAFDTDGARVIGRAAARAAPGGLDARPALAPLVGRDRELRELREAVERTAAESHARTLLLVGPPGIGKSRLRQELWRWLAAERPDWPRLVGRGEAARAATSYATIQEVLRLAAGLPEGTPLDEALERIEILVASARLSGARARGTADFLGELLGAPFPENAHLRTARADRQIMADRIRLAVGDLFDGWTADGPVVVGIEDLQWVDDASLALLELLAARLADRPLVLVATSRPELLRQRPDRPAGARTIELSELAAGDAAAIVEGILGRPEPAVVERAAGNPYFAEELALWVRDRAGAEGLPLTIEAAVQSRLDQLPAPEKSLLKRVAILGRRFWTEAAEALGEREAPALLHALRRRDLVLPQAQPRLHGCREWFFRHAVVQEVCLGMLTAEQRSALHARAARWLAERADAPPEDVAEHHERAGESALARPFWRRAAVRADERGDSEKVLAFSARVLARHPGIAPLPPADEHALRLRRLEALSWLARTAGEADELRAIEDCERAAVPPIDAATRAETRRRKSTHLGRIGERAAATESAREAVALAVTAGDPVMLVRTRTALAHSLVSAGDTAAAMALAEETAVQAEATRDVAARAMAITALSAVMAARGDHLGSLRHLEAARALRRELGDVRATTAVQVTIAGYMQALGDLERARRLLEEALAASRALGQRRNEGWVLHNLGLTLARLGDPAAGLAAEDAAIALAQEQQTPVLAAVSHTYRGLIALESGDAAQALQDAERSMTEAVRVSATPPLFFARTVRALALVALGRAEEALVECERVRAMRDAAGGMEELEVDLLLAHHDALVALGRAAEAAAPLDEATRVLEQKLARIDDPELRRCLAENIPAHKRLRSLARPGVSTDGS